MTIGDSMKTVFLITVFFLTTFPVQVSASLKIGLLPIEDSVPFYVAEEEKMYAGENLQVELIPFQSALERDSALAADAIDGAIDDPIGAILFDKGQDRLKITSICLGEKPAEGVFAILAAPGSDLKTVNDLKGVEIAVSNSTIIEYITDRILLQQGFKAEEIKKLEVVKMPIRMQMLLSDAVKAATLPEPLASIAISKGARMLVSDATGKESLSQTIIVFRSEVLKKQKAEIATFFRAYKAAVLAINSDPEKFRALFIDKGRIPPFLAKTYPIPVFPLPAPFSPSLYEPVMTWLTAKHLVGKIPYAAIVETDFLDGRN
jgi:NitT/TauT family transport system substrate-binding protein